MVGLGVVICLVVVVVVGVVSKQMYLQPSLQQIEFGDEQYLSDMHSLDTKSGQLLGAEYEGHSSIPV